jgi:ribosomal protein S18 acetylase RimI-like enzyme
MLIVGEDNTGARRFYERNGFELLQVVPTGAAYGKKLG